MNFILNTASGFFFSLYFDIFLCESVVKLLIVLFDRCVPKDVDNWFDLLRCGTAIHMTRIESSKPDKRDNSGKKYMQTITIVCNQNIMAGKFEILIHNQRSLHFANQNSLRLWFISISSWACKYLCVYSLF